MFSIIAVINDKNIYEENLKKSLSNQTSINYEIILIDNSNNQYVNMSDALNYGIKHSIKDYIIFSHPDILMLENSCLEKIGENLSELGDFGVVGIAGTSKKETTYSNIFHGENKKKVGKSIVKPIEIQTVDECFFIIKKETICKYPFDPEIQGFHLYSVNKCLELALLGYKNYVIPVNIWHKSAGASLDWTYYREMIITLKKYKNIDKISTTVKSFRNSNLEILKLYFFIFRNKIHHYIIK